MSGAHSRQKGRRFENEVVGVLRANGYNANRISEAGLPGPDIEAFDHIMCEAKIRHDLDTPDGARLVLEGLEDATIFFFRQDNGPLLVASYGSQFFDLLDWVKGQPADTSRLHSNLDQMGHE